MGIAMARRLAIELGVLVGSGIWVRDGPSLTAAARLDKPTRAGMIQSARPPRRARRSRISRAPGACSPGYRVAVSIDTGFGAIPGTAVVQRASSAPTDIAADLIDCRREARPSGLDRGMAGDLMGDLAIG